MLKEVQATSITEGMPIVLNWMSLFLSPPIEVPTDEISTEDKEEDDMEVDEEEEYDHTADRWELCISAAKMRCTTLLIRAASQITHVVKKAPIHISLETLALAADELELFETKSSAVVKLEKDALIKPLMTTPLGAHFLAQTKKTMQLQIVAGNAKKKVIGFSPAQQDFSIV